MITSIFLLNNDPATNLLALEPKLQRLVEGRFSVQAMASIQELKQALPKTQQAIIISATAPPQLASLMSECQTILPASSFITVLTHPVSFTEAMWNSNSQFITAPVEDFTWTAVLSTAVLQCTLQTKIMPPSKMDEVDNLLNRSYYMQRLNEEISVSRRHKSSLCCVILSVNYYRVYLDSYGYQFVNALLHFVGEEINQLIRYEDKVARVGDDELALLLPRCSEADAKKLIQRLASKLNKLVFKFEQYEEEISVFAGVASYPLSDETPTTPDMLIRYAHHALHQAKTSDEDSQCVSLFSEIKPTL